MARARTPRRVQCEGCHRWMAATSSVAGFGPKCAKRRGLVVARRRAVATPPVRPAEDQLSLLDELKPAA